MPEPTNQTLVDCVSEMAAIAAYPTAHVNADARDRFEELAAEVLKIAEEADLPRRFIVRNVIVEIFRAPATPHVTVNTVPRIG